MSQSKEKPKETQSVLNEHDILQAVIDGAKRCHLVYLDRDFTFVRVNEAYAKTCGYRPEEMVGKNHFDLYPHDENEAIFRRVRDSGEATEFHDKPFVFPDQPGRGVTYWDWTLEPIKNDRGKVIGLVFSLVETTERLKAEEALRESETKYSSLFKSMNESFTLFELVRDDQGKAIDFRYLDVNSAQERLVGRKKEETIGKRFTEVFGRIEQHWLDVFDRVEKTGEPAHFQGYSAARDRYYDSYVWRPAEGQVATLGTDITKEKRVEEALKEESSRLQAILDNTPVAVGFTDANGGVIIDNGVLAKIWAGSRDLKDVSGYTQYRAWWPETGEPVKEDDWPATRALEGESSTEIFDIERFDGSRGAIIVSATPIRDENGRIKGTVWTNQDVSELRRLELDLKRSNADLQHFAYIASHDLQEPLRMITSYLTLLENKYQGEVLDEKAREYMDFAIDGATRMQQLIHDILAYSRIEIRGEPFSSVDMNDVVAAALQDLKVSVDKSGAKISTDDLPIVLADRNQMVILLENLIGNAIKFRGKDAPVVHISVAYGRNYWTISVKDNGIGIPTDQQDRLFAMFQRLHTREEYEGTGIGLAIAKKIVDRHGGRIWIESEGEGKGASFLFTVPKRA